MNVLYIKDGVRHYDTEIINESLRISRTLLISNKNIYQSNEKTLVTNLMPQDRFLDDVSIYVMNHQTSMILDLWNAETLRKIGQDVDSLVLSLLGTFINNVEGRRHLLVDCFNELSDSVKKRILEIAKYSHKYNVMTFISVAEDVPIDSLLMDVDVLYMSQAKGVANKTALNILDPEDEIKLDGLKSTQLLLKRKLMPADVINIGKEN
ncbi:hypothetical protein G7061_07020 [Erysipelothrix sp. HDW6B]|uniref:hypothetical protein n=1 Tax=Erysipelothrix sp. HDW6B TaxID=2714929 RepID=UPI00140A988A|nr:hypothetical protein [Erysipelothrix sp. HDW6B]QIK86374.1 hypothetical protein G7061_07020 [Erysipelothrix sp. HDW6B]